MATLQSKYPVDPQMPIATVEELKHHLAQAAAVELSTVPLYLYAAYSIKTQGYKQWNPGISAFRAIRSVVIEEMLHLCLARNLLLSIDGADHVRFYDPAFVPSYPTPMLHRVPALELQLEAASPTVMQEIFMPLEQPAVDDAPPQPDQYNTLGQFYAAIEAGFEKLDADDSKSLWHNPNADLQYDRAYWNDDGGGSPLIVSDLPSAKNAIRTIVEQGEGAAPGHDDVPINPSFPEFGLTELSHYAKFSRIAAGIDKIGEVWPVTDNPKRGDYEDRHLRGLATLFDAAYCYVLCMIDELYATSTKTRVAGQHSPRYGLERTFIAAMGGLLYPIADLLVRQPVNGQQHAGPGFGFYNFGPGSKKQQLIDLCEAVLGHYPSLGGDDGVRRLIGHLPEVGE